jgi:pyruvate-formate lyase-activating enzyme
MDYRVQKARHRRAFWDTVAITVSGGKPLAQFYYLRNLVEPKHAADERVGPI